jgi:AcrR family transcriptional regulator
VPRLTDATRQERREQIAAAAMTCFARDGFASTSMADIIGEAGLSAGSIYSHFTSKAELVRFVAGGVLTTRSQAIAAGGDDAVVPPSAVLRLMVIPEIDRDRAKVLLQIWGEVPHDPELSDFLLQNLAEFRRVVTLRLRPWSATHGTDADDLAAAAFACVQGFIVRLALDPEVDPARLLGALGRTLDR